MNEVSVYADDSAPQLSRKLLKLPLLKKIEFHSLPSTEWAGTLPSLIKKFPALQVRFFQLGHRGAFDIAFLRDCSQLAHLSFYGCRKVKNVQALKSLTRLKSLELGIDDLKDLKILELLPESLKRLNIGEMFSRKFSLGVLERFSKLEELSVSHQKLRADLLENFPKLKKLSLFNVELGSLALHQSAALKDLRLLNCSVKNLDWISNQVSLESVCLENLPNLSRVAFLSSLPKLENVDLEDLPLVTALPALQAKRLGKLRICNLPRLRLLGVTKGGIPSKQFYLSGPTKLSLAEFRVFETKKPTQFEVISANEKLNSSVETMLGLGPRREVRAPVAAGMSPAKFWSLVEESARSSKARAKSLVKLLSALPPADILKFHLAFEALDRELNNWDLWGVAFLLNNGCGEDEFIYFRAFVISQGKKCFDTAVKNPEKFGLTLAGAKQKLYDEEFGFAAADAYERVTGGADIYEVSGGKGAGTSGTRWIESELPNRFPKLMKVVG